MWRLNDITKYCERSKCVKSLTQKDAKQFNTTANNTQLSKAMRYSQIVRKNEKWGV